MAERVEVFKTGEMPEDVAAAIEAAEHGSMPAMEWGKATPPG